MMNLSSIVPVPERFSIHAKLYLIGIVLNGFAFGIWNVVFQLYLTSLGFESAALGSIFMMLPIGSALLTIPAGVLADRYGKGKILIIGWAFMMSALTIILIAKSIEMFQLAYLLMGPSYAMFSVSGPLYASFFDAKDLDRAFGLNGFLNIITMSLSSLLGFVPPMLIGGYGFSLQTSYWVMVALAVGFWFGQMLFTILSLRGVVEPKRTGGFRFSLRSRGFLAKWCLISIIGNVGFGVFFNLFPYYVNKRFDVQSASLGALYFASNFVQAGAFAVAPRISKRLSTLKTIAITLGLCTPFYLMIPLAPNFAWLSAFYIIRLGLGNISGPLISALFFRLLYDDEKATANSISAMVGQGTGVFVPWLGGQIMQQVSLDSPAYLGSGLYVVYAVSYYFLLRNEKEKEAEPALAGEKQAN